VTAGHVRDRRGGLRRTAWLAGGLGALAGGTLLGWNGSILAAIASPPPLVRAALVAISVLVALRLTGAAMRRLDAGRPREGTEMTGREVAVLVRGVRYVFLAVAAVAAAAGWLTGSPLPFIVAMIIAGVDVVETSFLMLLVAMRAEGPPPD